MEGLRLRFLVSELSDRKRRYLTAGTIDIESWTGRVRFVRAVFRMIDHHGSPLSLLLLHNAVAIVVAVILTRGLRNRAFIALLALVIALGITFTVRRVNTATALGWWLFVQEPASSVYDPVIHDTMRRSFGVFGAFGLLTLFISPFVFAHFTAYQWTTPRITDRVQLANRQLRLGTVFLTVTVGCLLLGISSWLSTGVMVIWPIVFVAICLMARPLRWWTDVRRRLHNDKRLAEIYRRLKVRDHSALFECDLHTQSGHVRNAESCGDERGQSHAVEGP